MNMRDLIVNRWEWDRGIPNNVSQGTVKQIRHGATTWYSYLTCAAFSAAGLHVFVANEDDKHITELEFDKEKGDEGKIKSIVRLYWAPFNVLRKVDLAVKSQTVNEKTWSGTASLPVTFLPPKPSLVNAAVFHEIGVDNHWDSYYSITNPGIAIPDLMVLPRYKKINPLILSSETSYSSEWVSD